jgi:hypothetical protein
VVAPAAHLYRPWWGQAGYLEGVALFFVAALPVAERNSRITFRLTTAAAIFLITANLLGGTMPGTPPVHRGF